ncbi:MAG: hypothetical protein ACKVKT_03135 [Rhodospirillales bacterium]
MTDIRNTLNRIREKVDNGDYGRIYGAKEVSDDRLKIVYAQLRDLAPDGSVADKDAFVKSQRGYGEAVTQKENAYADWKTAETYLKLAFVEFDLWRSNEATNRGIDKRSTG